MPVTQANLNSKYDPPEYEKRKDALIAVYYVVIIILIGVPMWYLTTSTYRASLPLAQIEEFSKSKIKIIIKVNIICFEPIIDISGMINFEDKLFNNLNANRSFNDRFVTFKYAGYIRPASAKEWNAYKQGKSMTEVESLATLDGADAIYVFMLPRDTTWLMSGQDGLVRSRSEKSVVYLRIAPWEKIELILDSLLGNVLAPNNILNLVYKAVSEVSPKENLEQIPAKIRSLFTRVRTTKTYDWTFSLVVPYPLGGPDPEWNFARLEHLYLAPLQRKLEKFLNVRVSSQVIYGVRLDRLWPSRNGGHNERVYSKEDLTHVVNGLETYLGSSGNMHFVTYLASSPGQPELHLEQSNGVRSKLDSFTVPRWGGFIVANNVTVPIDGGDIMTAFLPQIRSLMGLEKWSAKTLLPFEAVDASGVTTWQLNNWLRERTVENVAIAQVTLHSVSDLLDKVVNMVIRDDVALSIHEATRLSQVALSALAVPLLPDGLQAAFIASQQALDAAETAFFHPSLLELLYFQEDQKYGIYIPFFVPVLLPLFFAALKIKPYLLRALKLKAD